RRSVQRTWTALPIQGWRRRRNARAFGACCIVLTRARGLLGDGFPGARCQRQSAACKGRAGSRRAPAAVEAAILDRLGEVRRRDLVVAGQTRDRARDAEDARVGARRETESLARRLEQAAAGRRDPAEAADVPTRDVRVERARARWEPGALA